MKKKDSEATRQLFHMLLGVVIVILLMYGFIGPTHIFFFIIIGVIISFSIKKYKIPVINFLLKNLEREKDLKDLPGKGILFYFIGVFFVLALFPLDIAMPAIMILAFGDSASHLFGVRYGKIKHPFSDKKFIEGFIAGFIAGFIGALVFVSWYEALLASFFAMTAEGIEMKLGGDQIDDNIIIPLVAAFVIFVVRVIF